MTEYIILVGLLAILLGTAVERYKEQIRVTIVGTGDGVETGMGPSNWPAPGHNGFNSGGATKTWKGKTYHWDGTKWA